MARNHTRGVGRDKKREVHQADDFQILVRAVTVRRLGVGWIDCWRTETVSAILRVVCSVFRTIGTQAFEVVWPAPDVEGFADLAAACRVEHGRDALAHRSVAPGHLHRNVRVG